MGVGFETASAVERISELSFHAQIPEGWQQGRGAFGGLVLGILLRAMEGAEADKTRVARTISGDLCGPVMAGAVEISVRVLRRGGKQSNYGVEMRQSGEVVAVGSAVFSAPRSQPKPPSLMKAPEPADWQAAQVLPGAPAGFATHYDYRIVGPMPFMGATTEAYADGWIREREVLQRVDAPALIARLDAWFPTLFYFAPPRPVATISFVAQVLVEPASLPPDEPLRYRARMASLSDGFFVELRELWRGDQVVALNQQTFAIIK